MGVYMKSFSQSSVVTTAPASEIADKLYEIREAISFATANVQDSCRFIFDGMGLNENTLLAYDQEVKILLNQDGPLSKQDMDIVVNMAYNLGYAFTQLMSEALTYNLRDVTNDATRLSSSMHKLVNYFGGQSLRQYPDAANTVEPHPE